MGTSTVRGLLRTGRLVLQQAVEWFRPFRPLRAGFGTTAQQLPQQDLLRALSFCRAVYGLIFVKGRIANATTE
jgi:hypothetical protein